MAEVRIGSIAPRAASAVNRRPSRRPSATALARAPRGAASSSSSCIRSSSCAQVAERQAIVTTPSRSRHRLGLRRDRRAGDARARPPGRRRAGFRARRRREPRRAPPPADAGSIRRGFWAPMPLHAASDPDDVADHGAVAHRDLGARAGRRQVLGLGRGDQRLARRRRRAARTAARGARGRAPR